MIIPSASETPAKDLRKRENSGAKVKLKKIKGRDTFFKQIARYKSESRNKILNQKSKR